MIIGWLVVYCSQVIDTHEVVVRFQCWVDLASYLGTLEYELPVTYLGIFLCKAPCSVCLAAVVFGNSPGILLSLSHTHTSLYFCVYLFFLMMGLYFSPHCFHYDAVCVRCFGQGDLIPSSPD